MPRRRSIVLAHLDAATIRQLAGISMSTGWQTGRRPQPQRIVDKMPDNYMYLGLLAALFPQAAFIHCRRDLRDVAVSCWMTDFRSIRWANDPEHIASRFQQYRRLMEHWRRGAARADSRGRLRGDCGRPRSVARRLLAACGLEWEPACLEFHRNRAAGPHRQRDQVRQPIYKQSVARWKNYETALAGLFAALPTE